MSDSEEPVTVDVARQLVDRAGAEEHRRGEDDRVVGLRRANQCRRGDRRRGAVANSAIPSARDTDGR